MAINIIKHISLQRLQFSIKILTPDVKDPNKYTSSYSGGKSVQKELTTKYAVETFRLAKLYVSAVNTT